jgi:uncharacterized SAM-binding protein YcdF (DUF218 family)
MRPARCRALIVLTLTGLLSAGWGFAHAGTLLYREDPLRHADALYVLGGSRFERPLEADDLYNAGYAPVILISPARMEPAEIEARRRGAHFPREAELVRDALVSLGVPNNAIVIGDGSVDNTAEEASLLKTEATRRGWHTVIVITSALHTRRTGLAMRRALDGTGVAVSVRASRYDPADPAHWWRHRGDVRFLLEEWPKLVAYALGLAD